MSAFFLKKRLWSPGAAVAILLHLLAVLLLALHPVKGAALGSTPSGMPVTLVAGSHQASGSSAGAVASGILLNRLAQRLGQGEMATGAEASSDNRTTSLDDLMASAARKSSAGISSADGGTSDGENSDPYAHASGAKLGTTRQLQSALRMSSDRCWHRPNPARRVRLRVSLDSAGALRGRPLVLGGGADSDEAARRAIAAVTGCAPFDLPILQGRPQTVDLDF